MLEMAKDFQARRMGLKTVDSDQSDEEDNYSSNYSDTKSNTITKGHRCKRTLNT